MSFYTFTSLSNFLCLVLIARGSPHKWEGNETTAWIWWRRYCLEIEVGIFGQNIKHQNIKYSGKEHIALISPISWNCVCFVKRKNLWVKNKTNLCDRNVASTLWVGITILICSSYKTLFFLTSWFWYWSAQVWSPNDQVCIADRMANSNSLTQ